MYMTAGGTTITREIDMRNDKEKYIQLPTGKVSRPALLLRFSKLMRDVPLEYQHGWDTLVYGTFEAIEAAVNAAGHEYMDRIKVLQIKEKFGGLRVYLDTPVDVSEILAEAESMSLSTCIFCGGNGQMRNDVWIHPSCDECESARIKKRGF